MAHDEVYTRNVIFLGRTGAGKSSLIETLSGGTAGVPMSSQADGCTQSCQAYSVKHTGITYNLVDTVGLGDPSLSTHQVLARIAEGLALFEQQGVHQFVFVTNGRLTKEVTDAYNLLNRVIFGDKMAGYVTLVVTRFNEHYDETVCRANILSIRSIAHAKPMVDSIPDGKIIHIENDWTKYKKESRNQDAKEDRDIAQQKLFDVLSAAQKPVITHGMAAATNLVSTYKTETELLAAKNESLEDLLQREELRHKEEKEKLAKEAEVAAEQLRQELEKRKLEADEKQRKLIEASKPRELEERAVGGGHYLKDLRISHNDDTNAVEEISNKSNDLSKGFGGDFIYLIAEWTDKIEEAKTNIEVEIDPAGVIAGWLKAKGTEAFWGRDDYALGREIHTARNACYPPISKVGLLRQDNRLDAASMGGEWKYTKDLNTNRGNEYLYICYMTDNTTQV